MEFYLMQGEIIFDILDTTVLSPFIFPRFAVFYIAQNSYSNTEFLYSLGDYKMY